MVIKAERKKIDKKNLRRIVALFKQRLQGEGIPFKKIILFGSYAKGNQDIDSDVDVAVVVSSNLNREAYRKLDLISWWAKQINVKLEPHVLSTRDLNNYMLVLSSELKKYGIMM